MSGLVDKEREYAHDVNYILFLYHHTKKICGHFLLNSFIVLSYNIFTTAGPALERFDLDLSTGTLALTFDEEMSDTTGDIDWTGVSLRTHVNGLEGSGVTLWSTEGESGWGDPVSTDSEFALEVEIHPTDLDEMKALSIGHNSSFTWITLRKGAFEAQYGGELNDPVFGTQVVGSNGFSVSTLTQDSTR